MRRQKGRRWVLQILYAWEIREHDEDLMDVAAAFFDRRQVADETRRFAEQILTAIADNDRRLDGQIDASAEHWDVERLAIVDRNILRMALAEFQYLDGIPFKVTIDQAIRLAQRYGGAESPRFVNGLLDAVARKLDLIPS